MAEIINTVAAPSQPQAPRSALFTCIACQVAFHSAELQRNHYRTDWHRYNLKRKMVELQPVAAEQFAQKLMAQQAKTQAAESERRFTADCTVCRKSFATENTYTNHVQSKKHKEAVAKAERMPDTQKTSANDTQSTTSNPKPVALTVTDETTEAEMMEIIDEKIAQAEKLGETDCLFCTHKAATLDGNMNHMTKVHSFFIPDIEYLVDLRGLIKYLGEKISVGNVCIYCNGNGRGLHSLEAVRAHMMSKGHCKIAYDTEDDVMEVVDYYDFTPSTANLPEGEDADANFGVQIAEDDMELVLPNGARVGHRSLGRYYKQSLRPTEQDDAVLINKLITSYSSDFGYESHRLRGARGQLLITDGKTGARSAKDAYNDTKHHEDFRSRVGVKANKLQRHFRAQIL